METQDSGNGKRSETETAIGPCTCDFCLQHSEYWQRFGDVLEDLSGLLIDCINENHTIGYNWLYAHVSGVLQAAGEQLENQQRRMH